MCMIKKNKEAEVEMNAKAFDCYCFEVAKRV